MKKGILGKYCNVCVKKKKYKDGRRCWNGRDESVKGDVCFCFFFVKCVLFNRILPFLVGLK